ncbi:IS110 family transposase [Chroococcidiopsis sp.]|uniref:IS110 family transposase n=1 Tax=Chroococcidiopsis sp. TaxID=3088168 RepID=UPI003F2B2DE9
MFNRILGLDVGRGSAVLCCLEEFPSNIQQHYKKLRNSKQFFKIKCDRAGVEKLLSFAPTGIVLEPTGYWYSQFWVTVAQKHDIPIYWIGHNDLDKQRGSYGFVNKRDEEDALCLAASFFDDRFVDIHDEKRFLKLTENSAITRIRELFNAKEQLQKIRTGLIAQLRQRLSYEFPEAARQKMKISPLKGYTPIIHWLATGIKNTRYDNKYKLSIAPDLGIAITDYTRDHAQTIITLELRITQTMNAIANAIKAPEFDAYHAVFDCIGFGLNVRALLLFNLYPFEKFLVDGKPWVEYERSGDKLQKRHKSLRKFQAFCGLSYSYKQSGDKIKRKFHGNGIIRSHLYIWSVAVLSRTKNINHNPLQKELSDRYQELRSSVKGKDALTRILFKLTRMLFYELVKTLTSRID